MFPVRSFDEGDLVTAGVWLGSIEDVVFWGCYVWVLVVFQWGWYWAFGDLFGVDLVVCGVAAVAWRSLSPIIDGGGMAWLSM